MMIFYLRLISALKPETLSISGIISVMWILSSSQLHYDHLSPGPF